MQTASSFLEAFYLFSPQITQYTPVFLFLFFLHSFISLAQHNRKSLCPVLNATISLLQGSLICPSSCPVATPSSKGFKAECLNYCAPQLVKVLIQRIHQQSKLYILFLAHLDKFTRMSPSSCNIIINQKSYVSHHLYLPSTYIIHGSCCLLPVQLYLELTPNNESKAQSIPLLSKLILESTS